MLLSCRFGVRSGLFGIQVGARHKSGFGYVGAVVRYLKPPWGSFSSFLQRYSLRVVQQSHRSVWLRVPVASVPCGVYVMRNLWVQRAYCKSLTKTKELRKRHVVQATLAQDLPTPWREIFGLVRSHIWWLVGAVLSALVVAYINIKIPLLLGQLINAVAALRETPNLDILRPATLQLLTHFSLQAALTFVYISLLSVMGERIATDLRVRLFRSLVTQDVAFFDVHRTGDLVGRLAGDVQEFKSAFKHTVSTGLRSVTQIVGAVASMYLISPQMTWITVTAVPVMVTAGSLVGHLLRVLSRSAQAQVYEAVVVADEALSNIRTVRSFAMEMKELQLYEHEATKGQALNEKLGISIGIFQGVSNFALNAIVLSVIYGGSKLIVRNELSPGDLMSFMVTVQAMQRSLAQISLLFGQTVRGLSASARVFEFINMSPSIPISGGKTIPFHSLLGDIVFENVTFAYPARPNHAVLENFHLHIPSGKVVAVCGSSGAGKTTVAALLIRFYEVLSGRVLVDGHDLRDLDPSWLRGHAIGIISQEPVLFSGSIKENIRYGNPEASDYQVFEAAKIANADTFVRSFRDGYDTVVGERGVTLSGGQKQRIAIARALLKNPSILILDEATSALDYESEKLVREALDKAVQGRTVLVIAHRLSTVQNADLIVVMHHGKIVEAGTHNDLMKRKEHYWNLVKHQQSSG